MAKYILRRLISVIPTLIGVTLVIFLFQRLIPGDPAVAMLGEHATEENVARIREQFGLNRPAFLDRDALVEADPAVVNLSAFETYFEEKRPFFIEGSGMMNFSLMFGDGDLATQNLFYSRRIGRAPQLQPDLDDNEYAKIPSNTAILGAAKVTGR
ncbi:MAG: hypothetical protein GYA81_07505, partial [Chloroflexi bacterium]|nr:hypothetical protein [Chloroflexota bacterium]